MVWYHRAWAQGIKVDEEEAIERKKGKETSFGRHKTKQETKWEVFSFLSSSRQAIFPQDLPYSIITAVEFNHQIWDGSVWFLYASTLKCRTMKYDWSEIDREWMRMDSASFLEFFFLLFFLPSWSWFGLELDRINKVLITVEMNVMMMITSWLDFDFSICMDEFLIANLLLFSCLQSKIENNNSCSRV
jgi:hypothetical protein